jgi:uncharacterized protein (DUF924 family)
VTDPRIDDVLRFWFGLPGEPIGPRMQRWFVQDDGFDAECRQRFAPLIAAAAAGELDAWAETARGALALVIVLDQLSRNVFRGTPRAFAQDARALAVTRAALAGGHDRELGWAERYMLRMPFQHVEDLAAQRESVASFTALRDEAVVAGAPPAVIGMLDGAVDYAERHARIVERFGRYPHRNEILGRVSTAEEHAFLDEPGSRF